MPSTVVDSPSHQASSLEAALRNTAALWYGVAVVGQWLFVYYVVGYFARRMAAGGIPALADTHLSGGYVSGDAVGNAAVAVHLLIAVLLHGAGPLQLVPQIRRRFPVFHRWTGRAFLCAAVVASLSGLYMVWVRGTSEGLLGDASNTIDAALIFIFGAAALRHALARDIDAHRRWALRLFMAVSAVWFVRLGVFGTIVLSRLFGIDFATIAASTFAWMHVVKLVVPLGVLEIYLRVRDRGGERGRLLAAALLLVATVLTAIGVYGAATIGWLPRVHG